MKIEGNSDPVILDLNPKKFEKEKDHLFFDFFSLYAKNFAKDDEKSHENKNSMRMH
jgi:hypothetical protein